MIKGSIMIKSYKTKKWSQMFDAWWRSRHDTLIVHCENKYVYRLALDACGRWRRNNGLSGKMTSARCGDDLYVMKLGNHTHAMEVNYNDEDGVIYYYSIGG